MDSDIKDKINICFCFSDIQKSLPFEWMIEQLNFTKFNLILVLINSNPDSAMVEFAKKMNLKTYHLSFKSNFSYFNLIFRLLFILKKNKIEVIHCHLLKANLIGLTSALLALVPKRIYTRHHSDFNFRFSKKGIYLDKWCNKIATKIVAISNPVKNILIQKEGVSNKKIELIYHGFDINYFKNYNENILKTLREKYNFNNQFPVIGVVARFTEYKGIQFIIPAFKKLIHFFPEAKLMLFNSKGDYQNQIEALLKELPTKNYIKVDFETNLSEVYRLFDCYVHVPDSFDSEAFGQTYIEALLCQIPSVFTISGIASNLIKNGHNAIVVDYKNEDQIFDAIMAILNNEALKTKLQTNCKNQDFSDFNLNSFNLKLQNLYLIN